PELRQAGGGIPAHGGQQLLLEERRVSGGSKRCNIRGNAREGCDFQELTSRQRATGHSGRLLGNRFSMPASFLPARMQLKQLPCYTKHSRNSQSNYHIRSSGTL